MIPSLGLAAGALELVQPVRRHARRRCCRTSGSSSCWRRASGCSPTAPSTACRAPPTWRCEPRAVRARRVAGRRRDAALVAAAADRARARRRSAPACARAARCRPSPIPTAPASSRSPPGPTRRSPLRVRDDSPPGRARARHRLGAARPRGRARRGLRRSRSSPSSTCSPPICLSPRLSASRRASSSAFFASGVNGMWPAAPAAPATSAPGPKDASTRRRTSSRSMPSAASASRSICGRVAERSSSGVAPWRREHLAGPAAGGGDAEQQVLGADAAAPSAALAAATTASRAPSAEPLEHQRSLRRSSRRPPCFLCTACLLTPSVSAICCHDQPARGRCHLQRLERLEQPRSEATAAVRPPGPGSPWRPPAPSRWSWRQLH